MGREKRNKKQDRKLSAKTSAPEAVHKERREQDLKMKRNWLGDRRCAHGRVHRTSRQYNLQSPFLELSFHEAAVECNECNEWAMLNVDAHESHWSTLNCADVPRDFLRGTNVRAMHGLLQDEAA